MEFFPQMPCGLPSEPGKMSQRSCVYFGARYILGPMREAIHLVHGPIGCGYYGKMVRGTPMNIYSTNIEEKEIVFGGINKLKKSLVEAFQITPTAKGAFVYLTCASGLIGEDAELIANEVAQEVGRPIKVVSCPGFSGYSQAKGHSLAYELLFDLIKPVKQYQEPVVNLVGEYNVAGETSVIKDLLSILGIKVHTVITGDTSWTEIEKMTCANLNLLICGSTAEQFCKKLKTIFGVPYIKVSFYGLTAIKNSLRKIGDYFGISRDKIEKIIKTEEEKLYKKIKFLIRGFQGKKAIIVLGAGRLVSLSKMLQELGFKVEIIASIFGRESEHVELRSYADIVSDNPGEYELEKVIAEAKPDIVFTNSREQWKFIKLGVPVLSFPQEKHRGPYAGYKGFLNFAQQIFGILQAPVWKLRTF